MKKALITGITGQDGSYLTELLIAKGYEVHGIVRHVALEHPQARMWRIRHLLDRIHIHSASMESYASIFNIISEIEPDECYHLAAQSYVSYSFSGSKVAQLFPKRYAQLILDSLERLEKEMFRLKVYAGNK